MFSAATKTAAQAGGYRISRSLRFNSADSAYLNRTPASATNRKTYTFSGWVKVAGNPGNYLNFFLAQSGGTYAYLSFNNSNNIEFASTGDGSSLTTSAVYRDYSAWYHIVLAVDTTQATGSNRIKLYVNGSQITNFSNASYPSQNADTQFNTTLPHFIGSNATPGNFFIGYATEINFIDGQALTPSSFGETNAQTGVWQPKAYSGSYGTNGFYLNFSDNSNTTAATLGKDYSGNGNNWTPNNFSVAAGAGNDSLVDSPTAYGTDTGAGGTVRGNYCTLNPTAVSGMGLPTLANGNLDASSTTYNVYTGAVSTIGMASGKWYWEYTATSRGSGGVSATGIINVASLASASGGWGFGAPSDGWIRATTDVYNNSGSAVSGLSTINDGDIINVAVDFDNGKLWFGKNGTWDVSGNPAAGTNQTVSFTVGGKTFYAVANGYSLGPAWSGVLNFGQRPFAYTAPSGFKALCTQNLPTPTIGATTATQAGKFFNPVLYTGTGSSLGVTGVGFQPDMVWIKSRSNAQDHKLTDAVRGTTKALISNTTGAETTDTNGLTAFNTDGFTVGTDGTYNTNTYTYVAWNWKANGAGSSNTAGSITSTVSANTTSGFSIVTWTGNSANATIGHGLGVAPSMVIIKYRGTTDNWYVYHTSTGAGQYLVLNGTGAAAASANIWQNTAPTSSVFSIGFTNNQSTIVAYCFAEVPGYSAFGSYTGNGADDGPFVFTGFKPAWILIKRSSTAGENWTLYDNKRNSYNVANRLLFPNSSDAEDVASATILDMVSNGFKLRGQGLNVNASGSTYIYAAFAENPFKYSLAR